MDLPRRAARQRRHVRAPHRVVGALAVLSVLLPLTSTSAAEEPSESWKWFLARNVVVVRESGPWLMDIDAQKYGAGDKAAVAVVITLSQAHDPDGSGPPSREEEHEWLIEGLPPEAMSVNENMSSGLLRTGPMGNFGRLNLTFERRVGSPPMTVPGCSDDNRWRRVDVNGTVEFFTQEDAWGTVAERPSTGRVGWSDDTCGVEECPNRGFAVTAHNYVGERLIFIEAFEAPNADHAMVSFASGGEMGAAYVNRRLAITVPPERVTIDSDLQQASIRGRASLGLGGTATFGADGDPFDFPVYACGDGKEATSRRQYGDLAADMDAALVTGDESTPAAMDATAMKRILRPAASR